MEATGACSLALEEAMGAARFAMEAMGAARVCCVDLPGAACDSGASACFVDLLGTEGAAAGGGGSGAAPAGASGTTFLRDGASESGGMAQFFATF